MTEIVMNFRRPTYSLYFIDIIEDQLKKFTIRNVENHYEVMILDIDEIENSIDDHNCWDNHRKEEYADI